MLRPTFLSFETAKRALNSSQLGLDTVGHNISNVNTVGYTRQRVDQVSINSGGYKTKYQAFNTQFPGQGSMVIGISQTRDIQLDKRYRTEASAVGEHSAVSEGLGDINALFDEISTTGSHAKMSEFLSTLDKLIATADSKEIAAALRGKAEQITQILNKNYSELAGVQTQQRQGLNGAVDEVNQILEQIASLNIKIKEDNFYGNPSLELNDKRNLLIDQLSEFMDIEVKRTPVKVSGDVTIQELSIEIKNSGNPNASPPFAPIVLVDSGLFNGLKAGVDEANGESFIELQDGLSGLSIQLDRGNGLSADITDAFRKGALKGRLDVLNGSGIYNTTDNNTRGIPYYQQALDGYASKFAEVMNNLNSLKVYDSTGQQIASISRPLFVSNEAGKPISAATIAVSEEWIQNPAYIETAAKNNALYAVDDPNTAAPDPVVWLKGTPMTATGIPLSAISGVDKDGYLVDVDGKRIASDGTILDATSNQGVNLKDLQRAMTESTIYYPFNISDYANSNGKLMVKSGNTGVELTVNAADVFVKDDGKIYLDAAFTTPLNYTPAGSTNPVQVTKDMLYRTQPAAAGTQYDPGEPTPNELLPGKSANDNLLAIKLAINGRQQYSNGYAGTFQEYLVDYQSTMAHDKEISDNMLDSSYNVLSSLADSRDGISAVSIDEEGISMMTFQNYYNAAARYMTTLDEALGQIIQGMGVVGR